MPELTSHTECSTHSDTQGALYQYVLGLADDALTLGHRLSEWSSNGPFLEEDLALSNVALDLIGRARMLYAYAAELEGKGRTEDDLAYLRSEREYRNLLIHELPRGDFADTIARQVLVDIYSVLFFDVLTTSRDETLAAIAAKTVKECRYHQRRHLSWLYRLGDGTPESHARIQTALENVWGYTEELFQMQGVDQHLLDQGVAVDCSALKPEWNRQVDAALAEATLNRPENSWEVSGGRNGIHTESLGHLLAEMQFVQRAYPGLTW